MAQAPDQKEVKRIKDAHAAQVRRKKASQAKLGKGFEPNDIGVMPEDLRAQLKKEGQK